jgi:uncharacterized membrane protein
MYLVMSEGLMFGIEVMIEATSGCAAVGLVVLL